jgi:hypothetical protein
LLKNDSLFQFETAVRTNLGPFKPLFNAFRVEEVSTREFISKFQNQFKANAALKLIFRVQVLESQNVCDFLNILPSIRRKSVSLELVTSRLNYSGSMLVLRN